MKTTLFESELKVMECLWERGDAAAADLAVMLDQQVGWNKNTTYTVIKKLIAKGFIERHDPGFVCHALISRETVEKAHTEELIDRLYGGSSRMFLSAFVRSRTLTSNDLNELRALIDEMAEEDQ